MRYFKHLGVWQRAHRLVLDIYEATNRYPTTERFSLVTQMRRCATSVPRNLAEGAARNSRADYSRFIDIAVGSVSELEYQLLLSADLAYMTPAGSAALQQECREIRAMLLTLRKRVLGTED